METQETAGELSPAPALSEAVTNTEPHVTEAVTATEGTTEQPEQAKEERTFTQSELDAAIQKRLLKEERRIHRRIEEQLRTQAQQAQAQVQPKREAFQSEEAYTQAQLEHMAARKAEQLLADREAKAVEQKRRESFMEKAEEASERYADFDAVVHNPNLPINVSMAEFIAESDLGADIAYYLGKNVSTANRIANLSPVLAARELARIETELASKPKAQASKAPAPINPVGNRGKASTSSSPSDDDDIDTWMRKERARVQKRFGR